MKLCLGLAATSFILRLMVVEGGVWQPTAYFATPCRSDGMVAGSFVALARRDPTDWAWLQRNAGRYMLYSGSLLLCLAVKSLVGGGYSSDDGLVLIFGFAALAVFLSGLIVLAMKEVAGAWLSQALEHEGLRAIGKYSYGMYMFHSLIVMVGAQLLSTWIRPGALMSKAMALAWVSAASFAAAWLSYHLYEQHFLRLKRCAVVGRSRRCRELSEGLVTARARSAVMVAQRPG
jgi:peptidoglycan/LPS O-acetylase OafA/YrhL